MMRIDPLSIHNTMNQSTSKSKDQQKLQEACKEFEAVFLNMLLKNMRSTVQENGFIQKSNAREIFESMLDEKIAEEATKGPGIGLAQQMYKQLSHNIKANIIDENI